MREASEARDAGEREVGGTAVLCLCCRVLAINPAPPVPKAELTPRLLFLGQDGLLRERGEGGEECDQRSEEHVGMGLLERVRKTICTDKREEEGDEEEGWVRWSWGGVGLASRRVYFTARLSLTAAVGRRRLARYARTQAAQSDTACLQGGAARLGDCAHAAHHVSMHLEASISISVDAHSSRDTEIPHPVSAPPPGACVRDIGAPLTRPSWRSGARSFHRA